MSRDRDRRADGDVDAPITDYCSGCGATTVVEPAEAEADLTVGPYCDRCQPSRPAPRPPASAHRAPVGSAGFDSDDGRDDDEDRLLEEFLDTA